MGQEGVPPPSIWIRQCGRCTNCRNGTQLALLAASFPISFLNMIRWYYRIRRYYRIRKTDQIMLPVKLILCCHFNDVFEKQRVKNLLLCNKWAGHRRLQAVGHHPSSKFASPSAGGSGTTGCCCWEGWPRRPLGGGKRHTKSAGSPFCRDRLLFFFGWITWKSKVKPLKVSHHEFTVILPGYRCDIVIYFKN